MPTPTFAIPAGFTVPPPPRPIAPAPSAPPAINQEELIAEYRAIRDKIKAAEAQLAESIAPLKDRRDQLETIMLDYMLQTGANSISTNSGTAYKSTRTSYTVDDPFVFREWAAANNHTEFFENRVSKDAVESWIKEGHALPPGIKVSSFVTANFRK